MIVTPRPFFVLFKAVGLFVVFNIAYGLIQPPVAKISAYNLIFPGLERMPFGASGDPYTVEVHNVDAMFAAHEISAPKAQGEVRVVLIGDSSIWGEGLSNDETLSAMLNDLSPQCNGRTIKLYNLGYPHPSILKDLVFIQEARERAPDAIVWFITLNTLMNQYRVNPFFMENRARLVDLMAAYNIQYGARKVMSETQEGFYNRTLLGQREFLARWMKLQALGLVWSATGLDTLEPLPSLPVPADIKKDPTYRDLAPGTDLRPSLLLEALDAGEDLAGDVPVLLVNEPIFIAGGMNSDVRYNDLYPRWAYDQYREIVSTQVQISSWPYLDLWNALPPENFTDSALHLNAQGEQQLAGQVNPALFSLICK